MPKPSAGTTTAKVSAPHTPTRRLTRSTMIQLYAARRHLDMDVLKETGLRMQVDVYFKDPRVAKVNKEIGLDPEFTTPWEPGLRDGPTSARFVVVDYDSTTNRLSPPAKWDMDGRRYTAPDGTPLDKAAIGLPQFHQQSVWAIVQNTLNFFEGGFALGRRVSWAFEGNRLIIVPHAGYGQNAYYDRDSKSLQFYWFDTGEQRVYTCLSSDIVNHEFGHAVLDGLRPHYYESVGAETSAFHEFIGDLTAILMAFQNNGFRQRVLQESAGRATTLQLLADLAHEFGSAVTDDAYLRSALNTKTMKQLAGTLEPHDLSEVLTGTMFDILKRVFARHRADERARATSDPGFKPSDRRALAQTVPRMQMLAIQPLDLLPPCSVTFRDYALAVLRSEQVANPTDPSGYRAMMIDCFIKRGILKEHDRQKLLKPMPLFARPVLDVFHGVDAIAASRGGAYRFLDDNRARLFIPHTADIIVADVVRASKLTREGRALPEQIIVQYLWHEDLTLKGARFGRFAGEQTTMLCGGTMVLDQNGNLIHWARKPGSADIGAGKAALAEKAEGEKRRRELLDIIAARVAAGMIGPQIGGALGLLERASTPFGFRMVDGAVRFQRAPHFSIRGDAAHEDTGDRQWQISF
jgi:hypothetical protein